MTVERMLKEAECRLQPSTRCRESLPTPKFLRPPQAVLYGTPSRGCLTDALCRFFRHPGVGPLERDLAWLTEWVLWRSALELPLAAGRLDGR